MAGDLPLNEAQMQLAAAVLEVNERVLADRAERWWRAGHETLKLTLYDKGGALQRCVVLDLRTGEFVDG